MAQSQWTRIFRTKAKNLNRGDSWRLEFDENLVPDGQNPGWEQYIGKTSARFRCTECGRLWPSNLVKVVFHMRLKGSQGVVKVRPLCQGCNNCTPPQMEKPDIDDDNIRILLKNLVDEIRRKCYHEYVDRPNRPFVSLDVRSSHEPDHCEACIEGICTRS